MRSIVAMLLAASALTPSPTSALAETPSAALAAAVTAPGRPADMVKLDESRKPAQVLTFLGLKPDMKAADLMTGTGYWAEIMARAVGPKGSVTAFEPVQFYNDEEGKSVWEGVLGREHNIAFVRYPFDAFATTFESLDFAIINLSYHDLYWESEKYKVPRTDPAIFVKALYAAMKPGGIVGVIDHVGQPGDTRETVEKYHRIDPAVVKADYEKAGFELVGTSDMLANPQDTHQMGVFDPSIRGKTDRFLFKFRKPG